MKYIRLISHGTLQQDLTNEFPGLEPAGVDLISVSLFMTCAIRFRIRVVLILFLYEFWVIVVSDINFQYKTTENAPDGSRQENYSC